MKTTTEKVSSLNRFKKFFVRMQPKNRFVRVLFYGLLVLFALGVVYGGRIAYDRYKFARLESALNEIGQDLVNEFGGEITVSEGRCSRSQGKSGQGRLSCSYAVGFDTQRVDFARYEEVLSFMGAHSRISKLDKKEVALDHPRADSIDIWGGLSLSHLNGFNCSFSTNVPYGMGNFAVGEAVAVSIRCSDMAIAEYY